MTFRVPLKEASVVKPGVRSFVGGLVKSACAVVLGLSLLEAYLFCFFTFCRVEWVYHDEYSGSCHEIRDESGDVCLSFRLDDYSSMDRGYTFEALLWGVADCGSAQISVVRNGADGRLLAAKRLDLAVRQTDCGVSLKARLPADLSPKEKGETLSVELSFPHDQSPSERQRLERLEGTKLELKAETVRHFKSV